MESIEILKEYFNSCIITATEFLYFLLFTYENNTFQMLSLKL